MAAQSQETIPRILTRYSDGQLDANLARGLLIGGATVVLDLSGERTAELSDEQDPPRPATGAAPPAVRSPVPFFCPPAARPRTGIVLSEQTSLGHRIAPFSFSPTIPAYFSPAVPRRAVNDVPPTVAGPCTRRADPAVLLASSVPHSTAVDLLPVPAPPGPPLPRMVNDLLRRRRDDPASLPQAAEVQVGANAAIATRKAPQAQPGGDGASSEQVGHAGGRARRSAGQDADDGVVGVIDVEGRDQQVATHVARGSSSGVRSVEHKDEGEGATVITGSDNRRSPSPLASAPALHPDQVQLLREAATLQRFCQQIWRSAHRNRERKEAVDRFIDTLIPVLLAVDREADIDTDLLPTVDTLSTESITQRKRIAKDIAQTWATETGHLGTVVGRPWQAAVHPAIGQSVKIYNGDLSRIVASLGSTVPDGFSDKILVVYLAHLARRCALEAHNASKSASPSPPTIVHLDDCLAQPESVYFKVPLINTRSSSLPVSFMPGDFKRLIFWGSFGSALRKRPIIFVLMVDAEARGLIIDMYDFFDTTGGMRGKRRVGGSSGKTGSTKSKGELAEIEKLIKRLVDHVHPGSTWVLNEAFEGEGGLNADKHNVHLLCIGLIDILFRPHSELGMTEEDEDFPIVWEDMTNFWGVRRGEGKKAAKHIHWAFFDFLVRTYQSLHGVILDLSRGRQSFA